MILAGIEWCGRAFCRLNELEKQMDKMKLGTEQRKQMVAAFEAKEKSVRQGVLAAAHMHPENTWFADETKEENFIGRLRAADDYWPWCLW